MTACAGASSDPAPRFKSVPLAEYSPSEQALVADKIDRACGSPPACPYNAVLERWVIDYGRLRAMIRAIDKETP